MKKSFVSRPLNYFIYSLPIGSEYWRLTENAAMDYVVDFDYPKKIHLHWSGVPDNLDAASVYTNNEVYFFKGLSYYFTKKSVS